MKIHSIYFKNINSLAGENRINFSQPPLSDAGVFAITGPNGSGKTSILDAITLGMYGVTFKFDRPSDNVMTRGTAECFSEVIFSLEGEQYRSSWSVNREEGRADGKVMPPKMKLSRMTENGEILEDEPNKVRDRISSLSGMDFRRFTRSILLAQGHFTSFLNALDTERLDVLEQILSQDIYQDYKKEIQGKAEGEKQHLQSVQTQLEKLTPVKKEEIEAREHDLNDFKDQRDDLKDEINSLKQQRSWLQDLDQRAVEISRLEKTQNQTESDIEKNQAQLEIIAANQDVLSCQTKVEQIEEKHEEIRSRNQTLGAYKNEATQLQNKLKSLAVNSLAAPSPSKSIQQQQAEIEELNNQIQQSLLDKQSETGLLQALEKQVVEKQSVQKEVMAWLQEHESEKFLLDDFPDIIGFKNLKEELRSIQASRKTFSKRNKATVSTLTKNTTGVEKSTKQVAQLKLKLEKLEKDLGKLAEDGTREQITDLRTDQQARVHQYNELFNLAVMHDKLDSGNGLFQKLFSKDDSYAEDLKEEFAILTEELKKEQNIYETLDRGVAFERLLKQHEDDRDLLVDGEPCPLCGSVDHPFVNKRPKILGSTIALADQKKKFTTLQSKVNKSEQKIKYIHKQEEEEDARNTRRIQLQSEWLALCTRLNRVSSDLKIDDTGQMKNMLNEEQSILNSLVAKEKSYLGKLTEINKTKTLIEQHEAVIIQIQGNLEQLNNDWKNQPEELNAVEQKETLCEQKLNELTLKLTEQLTGLGVKIPLTGREGFLNDKIEARRKEYQIYHQRQQDLNSEIEQIKGKVEISRKLINDIVGLTEDCKKQLQKEETAGLHLALVEKQTLVVEIEKQIAEKETELAGIKQVLLQGKVGSKFQSYDDLAKILSLVLGQSNLEQEQMELEKKLEQLSIDLNRSQAQLDAEKAIEMTRLSRQETDDKILEFSEKQDIAILEINRLEHVVREQQETHQQFETLTEQLGRQKQIVSKYENDVLECDENGVEFRSRVKAEIAEKLLSQANQYLEKISGRYYVRQGESEHGLSLLIEDTHRSNSLRMPKTLSGGESFVVSLSLALGLSEMANNGKSVDSLFLDEGFGNLDEESLYLVLSTLKSLHHQGKMVGVISHVKGVKDRIETQIEMSKLPNGTSSFAVVS